jgi:hypothetical protein
MMFLSWRAIHRPGELILLKHAFRVREFSLCLQCNEANTVISAQERRWEVKTPVNGDIIEEASQYHPKTSGSFHEDKRRGSCVTIDRGDFAVAPSPHVPMREKRHVYLFEIVEPVLTTHRLPSPVIAYEAQEFESLRLHDTFDQAPAVADVRRPSLAGVAPTARTMEVPPLSQWETLAPRGVPQKMHLAHKASSKKVAVAHSSTLELTRFQKFIRRMESAGPRIVLDRLKEEWQASPGEEVDEQVSPVSAFSETYTKSDAARAREATLAPHRLPDAERCRRGRGHSETFL